MDIHQSKGLLRVGIVLEGGGRFEGTAEIADIRLENERVEWKRIGDNSIEVSGAINAYIYSLLPRTNEVQGQGVQIPFTRVITDDQLRTDRFTVSLDELNSEHEFNPITGEFQHTVRAVIVLAPKTEPAQPKSVQSEQAQGETLLSQIASGERPQANEDRLPASTRPPSPEEFEDLRRAIQNRKVPEDLLPPSSPVPQIPAAPTTALSDTTAPSEATEFTDVADSVTTPEATEPLIERSEPREKEDGGPLEWKPFPPPMT